MYNYRLQLQYDGGRYDGWVRMGKDSNSNTIECKIKEIIQKMTGDASIDAMKQSLQVQMLDAEQKKVFMHLIRQLISSLMISISL